MDDEALKEMVELAKVSTGKLRLALVDLLRLLLQYEDKAKIILSNYWSEFDIIVFYYL